MENTFFIGGFSYWNPNFEWISQLATFDYRRVCHFLSNKAWGQSPPTPLVKSDIGKVVIGPSEMVFLALQSQTGLSPNRRMLIKSSIHCKLVPKPWRIKLLTISHHEDFSPPIAISKSLAKRVSQFSDKPVWGSELQCQLKLLDVSWELKQPPSCGSTKCCYPILHV